jgi:RNA polymerase sigma-70 factor, ECF subfamily
MRADDAAPIVVDEALVRAHQAAVWRHLRVLGADPEVATDLTQEAFLTLLRTPLRDQGPVALRAWLRTTARHLFLEDCRRRRRQPTALDPEALERVWQVFESGDDGDGFRKALAQCLDLLAATDRELLHAATGEAASLTDLATARQRPLEAVRAKLRRLKQELRGCVERRLHDAR